MGIVLFVSLFAEFYANREKKNRVAMWNKFKRPERTPLYYLPWTFLHFWWTTPSLQSGLKEARKSNLTLPRPR